MPSDNFEQKIRDKFAHAQIQPRPELWLNIEQQIATQKSRRRGLFWLFGDGLIGIMLLLLLFMPPFQTGLQNSGQEAPYLAASINFSNEEPCDEEIIITDQTVIDNRFSEERSVKNPPINRLQQQISSSNSPLSNVQLSEKTKNTPLTNLDNEKEITPVNQESNVIIEFEADRKDGNSFPEAINTQENTHTTNEAVYRSSSDATQSAIAFTETNASALNQVAKSSISHLNNSNKKLARNLQFQGHLDYPNHLLQANIQEQDPPMEGYGVFPRSKWGFYGYVINSYNFNHNLASNGIAADASAYDFFTFDNRSQNNGDPLSGQLLSIRFPRLYIQAGIGAEYFLRRNLSIQAGFGYSVSDFGLFREGYIRPSVDIPSSGAITVNQESLSFDGVETFRNRQFELPIYLNYYLHKGRRSWVFSLGGALNRNAIFSSDYTAEKTILQGVYGGNRSAFSQNLPTPEPSLLVYRSFNAYLAGRIHYQYALNSNLHVYVGPNFQTQILKVYDGQGAQNQFPHRIGLELGIKWRRQK